MSKSKVELVVAVSLNTAFTHVMRIPNFSIGGINREEKLVVLPSSKAINAARIIRRFGRPVLVIGISGQVPGKNHAARLAEEGISSDLIFIEEDTRLSLEIFDPVQKTATLIAERGPTVTEQVMSLCLDRLDKHLPQCRLMILAGSVPQGMPDTTYAEMIKRTKKYPHVEVLLDCRGPILRAALETSPFLVRINRQEAEDLSEKSIKTREDATSAASAIRKMGSTWTSISLGGDGAVLVTPEKSFQATPPQVDAISPIGSGDAMLAGFALGLLDELPPDDVFRLAMACGVMNATSFAPGVISPSDVTKTLSHVVIEEASPL